MTEGPDVTEDDQMFSRMNINHEPLMRVEDAFLNAILLAGGMYIVTYQGPGLLQELRVHLLALPQLPVAAV